MMIDSAGMFGRPYPRRVARRQRLLTPPHTVVNSVVGGSVPLSWACRCCYSPRSSGNESAL